MTDGERLAVGLAVSLALHYLLLGGLGRPAAPAPGPGVAIGDFLLPQVGVSLAAPLSLEQAEAPPADPSRDAADRCRQAVQAYLEEVRRAVHGRRMVVSAEGKRLVGNAAFTLRISRDGRFDGVTLASGSGLPLLDQDAEQAIRAASGLISRPPCLGSAPLAVTITVKYQFGL